MTHDPMDQAEPPGKQRGGSGSAKIVTVKFRQDTLFAVETDEEVYVAIKPICDALGLNWSSQHDHLHRDSVLSEGIRVIRTPCPGGSQETVCLRLQLVNGWLLTIDDARVKSVKVREKVLAYKRECYDVLFQHFYGRRNAPGDETHEGNAPKVKMVTEARHTFGVPAAKQLWLKLQLPVVPAMIGAPGQGDLFHGIDEKAA